MATKMKTRRSGVAVLLWLAIDAVGALNAAERDTEPSIAASTNANGVEGGLRASSESGDGTAPAQSIINGYVDDENVGDEASLFERDYRPHSADAFPESRNLVVGGVVATREYPSFASMRGEKLREDGSVKSSCDGEESNYCWAGCGGALISKRHVLTAGHCVDDKIREKLKLRGFRVGAECRRDICHDDAEFGEAEWDDVDIHPYYDEDGWGTIENDVAIVVLQNDISLDYAYVDTGNVLDKLMEGTLPELIAVGHGKTSGNRFFSSSSSRLLEAHFWGLPESNCESEFGDKYDGEDNGDGTMFCAGQYDYDQPETSVCNGDSGGPLYSLNAQENSEITHLSLEHVREVQVGITSWGKKSCAGGVQAPSVFAKVSKMAEWFGPIVCNYFQHKEDRPVWCDVCNSNFQGHPPRWCEDLEAPISNGGSSIIQDIPEEKPSSNHGSFSFVNAPDTDDENLNAIRSSSSGNNGIPQQNPVPPAANVPEKAPHAPLVQKIVEQVVPIVEEVVPIVKEAVPVVGDITIEAKCKLERVLKHCTFGSSAQTFCTCGFIQDQDPSDRKGSCRRSAVEKICTLSCAGKCLG